jgi:hypothetical protein
MANCMYWTFKDCVGRLAAISRIGRFQHPVWMLKLDEHACVNVWQSMSTLFHFWEINRLPPYGMIFLRIHKCFLRNCVKSHVTHRAVSHHNTSPNKGKRLLPESWPQISWHLSRDMVETMTISPQNWINGWAWARSPTYSNRLENDLKTHRSVSYYIHIRGSDQ